jgi:hypothetical protein
MEKRAAKAKALSKRRVTRVLERGALCEVR